MDGDIVAGLLSTLPLSHLVLNQIGTVVFHLHAGTTHDLHFNARIVNLASSQDILPEGLQQVGSHYLLMFPRLL